MRRPAPGASISDEQADIADQGLKAMIPVGRPFLDYVLSSLADAGRMREPGLANGCEAPPPPELVPAGEAPRETAEELGRRTGLDASELKPSYHFVSAGEMHALLAISRVFTERGVAHHTENARFSSWSNLGAASLVLLGSSRTNTFLDSLQGGGSFVIATDCIRNTAPGPGEEPVYRGSRRRDDGRGVPRAR